MIPYFSQATSGSSFEPGSPVLQLNVSQGDYVFAIGCSRPGGGVPVLVTTHASSAWTVLHARDSLILAYRRATADELDMTVQFVYPDGFGGMNYYDAETFLIAVKEGVRIDAIVDFPNNPDVVPVVTMDGFTLSGGGQFPGPADTAALWVIYSQDGYPLPLGILHGAYFPFVMPSGWGFATVERNEPITILNASLVPVLVGTFALLSTPSGIVEFPRTFEYKSTAGDSFLTAIDKGGGGGESRRSSRLLSRKKWLVSLITPASFRGNQQQFVDLLMAFFLNSAAKVYPFRIRDPIDFRALHEAPVWLGSNSYQLVKRYQIGGRTYVRNIYKPITSQVSDWQGNALADTIHLYRADGSEMPRNEYVVDTETGVLFAGFADWTMSFEFDFPARFDTDELALQVEESFVSGGNIIASVKSLPLIEVLPPEF
jgi:uncharacterized protein (TIGR02217 family)